MTSEKEKEIENSTLVQIDNVSYYYKPIYVCIIILSNFLRYLFHTQEKKKMKRTRTGSKVKKNKEN